MLLSIVMMVKNEERNIERTLKALSKITRKIDSEIIILDTGSSDNTVEIAKMYTDSIYYEKWNSNFADIRNKSISYANGEWILIVDADEELTDETEIIRFFEEGNHQKYKSGSILLKNISNEGNFDNYAECSILRFFKNDSDFRYVGAIHEQPVYKEPIYEVALGKFNHYGYIYQDEEVKQKKMERNRDLLLNEIAKNPYDPYINYQLGKQYIISNNLEEAILWLKKSLVEHKKINKIPDYVYENLAKAYLLKKEYSLCINICEEFSIKMKKENLDITYFIAKSQKELYKFEDSLSNYFKYLELLKEHESSSINKNLYSETSTSSLKKDAIEDVIRIYHEVKKYDEIILMCEDYFAENEGDNSIYFILINALYKTNKLEGILDYYSKGCKTTISKSEFITATEILYLNISEENRINLSKVTKNIEGSYGNLNKIRLKEVVDLKFYNNMLVSEKLNFYGDIIYYGLNNSLELSELLSGIDSYYLEGYFDYLVRYKKELILKLYDYLASQHLTLNIELVKLYKSIAKVILLNGGLYGQKYENLFYVFKMYVRLLIRETYNPSLKDEELLRLTTNVEERFVLQINVIEKIKDKAEYVKMLKELLIEYPQYKKAVQIIIDKFKESLNESIELKELKVKYKAIIKQKLNNEKPVEAFNLIKEYENIFNYKDIEILNMKSIIYLLSGDLNGAEASLKEGLLIDINHWDITYNIAYLKEVSGDLEEARLFYLKIVKECEDKQLVNEARGKINELLGIQKMI